MNSSWKNFSLLTIPLLVVSLLVAPALSHFPGPPKKGEIGRKAAQTPAPKFVFMDQEGRTFHAQSLQGKVALVTFIFTTCVDICPLLTAKFASIQRTLKTKGRDNFFFVSITTDPDVDTPQVLKSYAHRFEADFRSWAFLTGKRNELSKVWEAFGVKVKKLGKGQVQHTGLTTLIDRKGVRQIDYFGDIWQEKEVLKDISMLAAVSQAK
jgi:protein SCO1/2